MVAGVALIGIGLGALSQQYTLVVQNAVPRRDLGVATASLQFFRNVGATIGTAVFGTVLSAGLDAKIFAHLPPELADTVPHGSINAGPYRVKHIDLIWLAREADRYSWETIERMPLDGE